MASTSDRTTSASNPTADDITERHVQLRQLTVKFLDAFNRCDLDAVVGAFAPNGVYDEFNGKRNEGHDEVRAAFAPQFTGAFGEMKFLDEDMFIDPITGKVMASWVCTLEVKGKPTSWRGLDLIHYEGDRVVHKSTYAKAKGPLFS